MGDVQIQSHQEPIISNSPMPLKQRQQEFIGTATADHSPAENTELLSTLCLHNGHNHRHYPQPPCTAATNSTKRCSPFPLSSSEPSAKKFFCDQEDLSHHGFSAVPLPLSLGSLVNKRRSSPVFRRCVSDISKPTADSEMLHLRENGLPPLPSSLKRCVSDVTPSQSTPLSPPMASEEPTPDSMRLKRMKERLMEMRQWWDEVIKDAEEEEKEKEECAVAEEEEDLAPPEMAEDDLAPPSQDELAIESEEAVSVEWADKCVSLTFGCPCGKGYQVLLSEKNCFYKLL